METWMYVVVFILLIIIAVIIGKYLLPIMFAGSNDVFNSDITKKLTDAMMKGKGNKKTNFGIDEVWRLLEFVNVDQNQVLMERNNDGNTPVHIAAMTGNVEIINAFNEKNHDFNMQNKQGQTPLHISAIHNNVDVFKRLLELDALPFYDDKKLMKALDHTENKFLNKQRDKFTAIQNDIIRDKLLKLIIDNSNKMTAEIKDDIIQLAEGNYHTILRKCMIQDKVNIFHLSVQNNWNLITHLLGANKLFNRYPIQFTKDESGNSILHYAINGGKLGYWLSIHNVPKLITGKLIHNVVSGYYNNINDTKDSNDTKNAIRFKMLMDSIHGEYFPANERKRILAYSDSEDNSIDISQKKKETISHLIIKGTNMKLFEVYKEYINDDFVDQLLLRDANGVTPLYHAFVANNGVNSALIANRAPFAKQGSVRDEIRKLIKAVPYDQSNLLYVFMFKDEWVELILSVEDGQRPNAQQIDFAKEYFRNKMIAVVKGYDKQFDNPISQLWNICRTWPADISSSIINTVYKIKDIDPSGVIGTVKFVRGNKIRYEDMTIIDRALDLLENKSSYSRSICDDIGGFISNQYKLMIANFPQLQSLLAKKLDRQKSLAEWIMLRSTWESYCNDKNVANGRLKALTLALYLEGSLNTTEGKIGYVNTSLGKTQEDVKNTPYKLIFYSHDELCKYISKMLQEKLDPRTKQ
jgi:uncharacterized protein YneF (UPF0154 family)